MKQALGPALIGLLWLLAARTEGLGQDNSALTIRVDPREIVVPVVVLRHRERSTEGGLSCAWVEGVTGLSKRNFRVLEDGIEQHVSSVAVDESNPGAIQDNLGYHAEFSSSPSGIWFSQDATLDLLNLLWNSEPGRRYGIFPAIPKVQPGACPDLDRLVTALASSVYLLTYVPPPSAEGSCHRIEVKLSHSDGKVQARNQYCNTRRSFSDPLLRTGLGNQLESYLSSTEPGALPLTAQAAWFFGDEMTAKVYIAVNLPWKEFESRWTSWRWKADVAILGLVRDKSGAINTRFSDVNYSDLGPEVATTMPKTSPSTAVKEAFKWVLPSSFVTQLDLAPGKYTVELGVTDGKKNGRVDLPLEIDHLRTQGLAVSSIVLCKRYRKQSDRIGQGRESASKYMPLVSKGIAFTPTGETRFRTSDAMAAYFEVHEPLLTGNYGSTRVQFRMRVSDGKTGEIKADTGLRPADSYINVGSPVIPISQQIALDKLSPGVYRLEVQASNSAGSQTDWRAVSFSVE